MEKINIKPLSNNPKEMITLVTSTRLIVLLLGMVRIAVTYHLKDTCKLKLFYFVTTNDPLRSAESSRRLLLEQESESDPEPFSSLREECET